MVKTNQTHTAVENLKPESRYTHWTLTVSDRHYTTEIHPFPRVLFFFSYKFKVTPRNELGSGPSSEPVSFTTESGMEWSLEPSLLHLLSILLFSVASVAKDLLSKNRKTTLRFYEFTANTSRQSIWLQGWLDQMCFYSTCHTPLQSRLRACVYFNTSNATWPDLVVTNQLLAKTKQKPSK